MAAVSTPSGSRNDQVARRVRPAKYSRSAGASRPPTDSAVPRIGRPSGWSGQKLAVKTSCNQVVRGVLDHLDLLEDNALLATDFLLREGRIQQEVAQQIDGPREMLVEHLHVIAGVLLRGERVELSAYGVDLLRDGLGRARRGPLEEHVLHEVRDACPVRALVPGTPGQPRAEADGTHRGHRLRK